MQLAHGKRFGLVTEVATPHGSDKNATINTAAIIDKMLSKLQLPTGQIKMQLTSESKQVILNISLQLPTGQIKMQPTLGDIMPKQ